MTLTFNFLTCHTGAVHSRSGLTTKCIFYKNGILVYHTLQIFFLPSLTLFLIRLFFSKNITYLAFSESLI